MKILLTTINSKYIHQNLAIRILYASNKNHEGLYWKEFIGKESSDDIAAFCSHYQLIAFSCYIWNITRILEVVGKIKNQNPKCKILLGGPEVSYEWKEIIESDKIDFIIPGEGEVPFSSFLASYPDCENIPGLIWKNKGVVIENEKANIFDLKELNGVNPYIFDSWEDLKNKIAYIEASRGCPYSCEFCLAGNENSLRYVPVEVLQANLLYLMEHGQTIKFLDRTFNSNPKFAISIFRFILKHNKPGTIFQFEIKADILQPELIEFIINEVPKGLFRFEIGIQSLNKKANDAIKRRQNFENTKKFIEQISDKIELHLDLIVGLPYDYRDDVKYSFEEIFKLYAPELQLGFLKFLKGTPIREKYKEHGYRFNPLPPYQIVKSDYLTENELYKIELVEKVLDIYWNKKRALKTLKYVASNLSIFDFLLGLGNYFEEKTGFLKYDVNEIYNNIYEYAKERFTEMRILSELIAMDYYLHYKVKPKIRFLPQIEKKLKIGILESLNLNQHKFRYIIHPIHFNLDKFINDNIYEESTDTLIVQYDGISKAQIILDV